MKRLITPELKHEERESSRIRAHYIRSELQVIYFFRFHYQSDWNKLGIEFDKTFWGHSFLSVRRSIGEY